MDVLHSLDQLVDIESSFHLMQSLSTLNQIGKRLILADVQHDVDVLLVFKVSVKSNNIFVAEGAMDFDFAGKLLAGLGPRQVCLWHHFERPRLCLVFLSLDGLETADLVAFSKATLH